MWIAAKGPKMQIGFVGLGIMGRPMAHNLIKAGHALTLFNRSQGAVEALVAVGAQAATSLSDLAGKADLIITMLPDGPSAHAVIAGPDGLLEGAKAGTIIIDMSSIAPKESQDIGAIAAAKDVTLIDAPVSGGEPKAIDGTLAIMAGGPADAFETAKPILLQMGSSAILVGPLGSGNVCKLANQIIVGINIAAVSEALVFAKKAGADPALVVQAISGGLAGSTVLDAKGKMMLAGETAPGARISTHIKDLTNAADYGDEIDAPLPLSSDVLDMLLTLDGRGEGGMDHSALARYYQDLAGVDLSKKGN